VGILGLEILRLGILAMGKTGKLLLAPTESKDTLLGSPALLAAHPAMRSRDSASLAGCHLKSQTKSPNTKNGLATGGKLRV